MRHFAIMIVAVLVLSMPVRTAGAEGSLDQMVQELQKNPKDDALREKIIKQAQIEKPAIPEEARQHFIEGSTLAKSAKDPEGQKLAVESFEEALKLAPWWSDAWYNLAVAQELARKFDAAKSSLKFYILTGPGDKEARDAQDRIYALNAKKKLQMAEVVSTKKANISPANQEEKFFSNLEGAVFSWTSPPQSEYENYWRRNIVVHNGQIKLVRVFWARNQSEPPLSSGEETGRFKLTGKTMTYNGTDGDFCNPITLNFSDDGRKVTHSHSCSGGRPVVIEYQRRN
jgi:hypothetical protein